MMDYKIIDEKILAGYEHLTKGNSINACDVWLEGWEGIKTVIVDTKTKNIQELQDKYAWTQFLSNYIQELAFELHNAGISNTEYFKKRINYCEEMLELYGGNDTLLVENTRRAIADSHYALGEKDKCDQLYSKWLEQDTDWGWGYIAWADCYWNDSSNLEKSQEILRKALSRESVKDRSDVLERAADLFEELGNQHEASVLRKEAGSFTVLNSQGFINTPIRSEKIGRNDPCTCGSGKKYKKCCG